ncbi:hypothetical protein E8E13_007991 [Curvularia kusanoi]|uniref:Uncharacterized protein n=1 Tax=Curvularia kusanoi TaxID=90978 RepID=A0A9P4TP41_CURKU|nr:hypothetical protein E8E13_007991 [Curvularia kusanoi]
MAPLPFEIPPEAAEWNHPITHADYTKLLAGHTPRDMDDKVLMKTEVLSAQNTTLFHIYHGWKPREVVRLEIVAGDPGNVEGKEWARIVRIWWRKEYVGQDDMTEAEAKKSAVATCNRVLGCEIEYGEGDEGGNEEFVEEGWKKREDQG